MTSKKSKSGKPAPSPASKGRKTTASREAKPASSRARAGVRAAAPTRAVRPSEPVACIGLRALREHIETGGKEAVSAAAGRRRSRYIAALTELEQEYVRVYGRG
jgi:hypothetical protein